MAERRSPVAASSESPGFPAHPGGRSGRTPSKQAITVLLRAWGEGDEQSLEKLTPLVYAELRRVARRFMARERSGHTLQATALVNEVYVRLVDVKNVSWQDRAHFFAVCARMMRRILTDFARARHYVKRGGGAPRTSLHEGLVAGQERSKDLLAVDDALTALATLEPRKSQVVELRFFGGLSVVEETAEVLKISPETVMRDWKFAKAWLARELRRGNS
ncbi:MAG TPA: sigma-70 family RNA polymerase sigma factor [Terracidiphilus sp.]|nr:sigma-70 family RNA polymerase sigma factor [Terracidiphilus sp.]